jgi:hypothetical protein
MMVKYLFCNYIGRYWDLSIAHTLACWPTQVGRQFEPVNELEAGDIDLQVRRDFP